MRHPALLDRDRTVVLLIDLQERYRTVLADWERTLAASVLLVRGAGLLGVPLLVTEQHPAGLGHTVAEVATHFPPDLRVVEKRTLSCCGSAAFGARVAATGRRQVLVAGIEAHACVNQTVHDLLAAGYQVHVARDGISSRHLGDVEPAWHKMCAAGMLPTSSEQAVLELVRTADAPEFRALQQLLKESP